MTEQGFQTLVEQLTERAQRQPLRYRIEVLGLALLGHLYVLVLLLGALVLSVGLLLISLLQPILLIKLAKIIWLPFWFAWSVLRALWVRFDPPQGRELKAEEAPALFAEIAAIRAAIPGPRPHHVLITDDYNAAVTERALLGPLGWWRNYLILGLPMMSALSPQQFRAVLAHEFGHFGAGDSRISGRIYRMRVLWARLQQQFDTRGGFFFRRFFAWFGPKFNAYSFVLARAQEYAADAASARLVGAGPAAEALVLAQIGADYQEQQVWRPLWQRLPHDAEPIARPYAQLLQGSHRYGDWQDAEPRLQRALRRRTGWSDTHPALNDRLAALGQTARVPAASIESAAVVLLGATAERLAREFDERWQAGIAEPWRERHQQRQQERRELAELDAAATASAEGLDRAASWRQAVLTETVVDPAAALPLFQAFAERHPEVAEARYAVGQILLRQGDEAGLALIRAVMHEDPKAIKPGADLAYEFLVERDREAEARFYAEAWRERDELEQRAQAERAQFRPTDDYLAHGLDGDAVARLRANCASLRWVGKVWLVQKRVELFPEQPAWLLLVKPRWYRYIRSARAEAALRQALDLSDSLTVALYSSDLKALFKKASKTTGSEIYRA